MPKIEQPNEVLVKIKAAGICGSDVGIYHGTNAAATYPRVIGHEMVGEIVVMPKDGTISLGYTFSYKHHRRGYAFEALTALVSLLHERYPEWDFISFTERENEPSMALLKKLGYKDMGYIPHMESQVFGKWTTPATEAEISQAIMGQQNRRGK